MMKTNLENIDHLFHITKLQYLNNILINGLIVNSCNIGFIKTRSRIKMYNEKYNIQPIFLTNDYKYIMETQLTNHYIVKNKMVVLKINLNDNLKLDIEDEYQYLFKSEYWKRYYQSLDDCLNNLKKHMNKSYICKTNIQPNLISIEKELT